MLAGCPEKPSCVSSLDLQGLGRQRAVLFHRLRSEAREGGLFILLKAIQPRVGKAGGQTKVFTLTIVSHSPWPCHCPTGGVCPARPNQLCELLHQPPQPASNSQDGLRTLDPVPRNSRTSRGERASLPPGRVDVLSEGLESGQGFPETAAT